MSNINDFVIENGVLKKYTGTDAEIVIPDGVTEIGEMAFLDCNSISSVIIPEGMTSIGDYAFSDCENLTDVSIPFGITYIGKYAFRKCKKLTQITIPASVTCIGNCAFDNCLSLNIVNISSLFWWCKITFGDYVFNNPIQLCLNNEAITELVIPDGINSIGNNTFRNCSSITRVVKYYYLSYQ